MTSGWRRKAWVAAACLAAAPAWAADGPARAKAGATVQAADGAATAGGRAASAQPAAAVSSDGRSLAASEVARIERRVEGPPSTTIWQARLPDGTLELTDRPPASTATAVQSRTYALPSDGQARQRAEAERAYWRKQAEAFEARRRERDRERESAAADVPRTVILHTEVHRPAVYHGYGWLPPDIVGGGGFRPGVVPAGVAPVYVTTPGAAQGRGPGFIGSGFGTAR